MTTTKARVVIAAPFGALDALNAVKTQIEAAKFQFRATNQSGPGTHHRAKNKT